MWVPVRIVGCILAALCLLLPAAGQAQTYTYTGAQLTPSPTNASWCPTVNNITGNFIWHNGIEGTLTSGPWSGPLTNIGVFNVNAQGVVTNWAIQAHFPTNYVFPGGLVFLQITSTMGILFKTQVLIAATLLRR